jgi:hypothetical protein
VTPGEGIPPRDRRTEWNGLYRCDAGKLLSCKQDCFMQFAFDAAINAHFARSPIDFLSPLRA